MQTNLFYVILVD